MDLKATAMRRRKHTALVLSESHAHTTGWSWTRAPNREISISYIYIQRESNKQLYV